VDKGKFDSLLKARDQGGKVSEIREGQRTRISKVGKRRDDEYKQISAYIRRDTHQRVKIALIEEDREFSDLVEELLREWLKARS
jgi:hypothetical protein